MVTFKQRQIVAQIMILPVPEPAPGLLSIDVERRESLGCVFTERLQRTA